MPQTFRTADRLTFHNVVCFNQEREERASVVPGSFFRCFDLLIGKPPLNSCTVRLGKESSHLLGLVSGLVRRAVAPGHWHSPSPISPLPTPSSPPWASLQDLPGPTPGHFPSPTHALPTPQTRATSRTKTQRGGATSANLRVRGQQGLNY